MKYTISRTEIADACVRKIILYISENFGKDVALKRLKNQRRKQLFCVSKIPFAFANDRNLTAKSSVKENNSYNTAKYGIEIIVENTMYSRKRNDIIEFE